ncbi:GRB2-associated and regulator of MAPK protein [Frankliniella fusca]|uniref:GRB2-associated and regulator of MAPK protein n=1 Tax=Frankliniella fusca TaxID=407009 RepID=A0AAE1LK43_9NEOP|nr:GRB2-associated and regulator of MAPK protein [Frankliniella fusca]
MAASRETLTDTLSEAARPRRLHAKASTTCQPTPPTPATPTTPATTTDGALCVWGWGGYRHEMIIEVIAFRRREADRAGGRRRGGGYGAFMWSSSLQHRCEERCWQLYVYAGRWLQRAGIVWEFVQGT